MHDRAKGLVVAMGVLGITACWATEGENMTERIPIQAVVRSYTPNAMHDHFDNGQGAIFDSTGLEILAPKEYAGHRLSVYHSNPASKNSLFRKIGQRIRFEIDKQYLAADHQVFTSALEKLSAEKNTGGKS